MSAVCRAISPTLIVLAGLLAQPPIAAAAPNSSAVRAIPIPPPRPADIALFPSGRSDDPARDAYRNDRSVHRHGGASDAESERQFWPAPSVDPTLAPRVSTRAGEADDPTERTGTIDTSAAPRMGGPGMVGPAAGEHSTEAQRWDVEPRRVRGVPLPPRRP